MKQPSPAGGEQVERGLGQVEGEGGAAALVIDDPEWLTRARGVEDDLGKGSGATLAGGAVEPGGAEGYPVRQAAALDGHLARQLAAAIGADGGGLVILPVGAIALAIEDKIGAVVDQRCPDLPAGGGEVAGALTVDLRG